MDLPFKVIKRILIGIHMEILNKYFDQLLFTRVDEKQTPTGQCFVVYGAGIKGMFGDGNGRYVLLFVPAHLAVQSQARIYELPWENLQTRNLHYSYRLKKQKWDPPRNLPDVELRVAGRTESHSVYRGPNWFQFEILLLHNPRKKTRYQYYKKMRVSSALETFSSVFNNTGEVSPMAFTTGPPQESPDVTQFDDSFELIT